MSRSGQRSTAARTCNLLSQFFKENGRFASSLEDIKGVEASRQQQQAATMNLLPNLEKTNDSFASFPSFDSSDKLKKDSLLDHGASQMTVFYNGQVIVFNDFPTHKAKEIMALATGAAAAAASSKEIMSASGNNTVNSNKSKNSTPAQFPSASLRRFFEKRKDRSAARAPYQVKNFSSMAPLKKEDQSKYPGQELEGQSSNQLDLNL